MGMDILRWGCVILIFLGLAKKNGDVQWGMRMDGDFTKMGIELGHNLDFWICVKTGDTQPDLSGKLTEENRSLRYPIKQTHVAS